MQIVQNSLRVSLQWRHYGRDAVSNHQPHDCLLNRLFGRKRKKISKLRVTGFCAGNSTVTGEFPAQMASNAESVSIWWRHHVSKWYRLFEWVNMHSTPRVIQGLYWKLCHLQASALQVNCQVREMSMNNHPHPEYDWFISWSDYESRH